MYVALLDSCSGHVLDAVLDTGHARLIKRKSLIGEFTVLAGKTLISYTLRERLCMKSSRSLESWKGKEEII